jgi:hypothetical protein
MLYGPDAFEEAVEVYRLGDIAVAMELIRLQNVFLGI